MSCPDSWPGERRQTRVTVTEGKPGSTQHQVRHTQAQRAASPGLAHAGSLSAQGPTSRPPARSPASGRHKVLLTPGRPRPGHGGLPTTSLSGSQAASLTASSLGGPPPHTCPLRTQLLSSAPDKIHCPQTGTMTQSFPPTDRSVNRSRNTLSSEHTHTRPYNPTPPPPGSPPGPARSFTEPRTAPLV